MDTYGFTEDFAREHVSRGWTLLQDKYRLNLKKPKMQPDASFGFSAAIGENNGP